MIEQHRRDILATITLFSTAEGGRTTPALTGYRPQLRYGENGWSAIHEYIGTDAVDPGQTVQAFLTFMSSEPHEGKLFPGLTFDLCEGSRVIGKGTIIKILNQYLAASGEQEHP